MAACKNIKEQKRTGWGVGLYRNKKEGWLAGICAGLADNFNAPVWLVRLIAVCALMVTGQLFVMLYIAGIFLIARADKVDQNPGSRFERDQERYESAGHGLKDKVFNYGPSSSGRVSDIAERMRRVDEQLKKMEGYVTSRKFQFNSEMKRS